MTPLLPLLMAAGVLPSTVPSVADCHAIDSESVLARDVGAIIPAFAKLPEDFLLGYVQTTGTPRIFKAADLEHLAKNRGVDLQVSDDLCLVRRMFIPSPSQMTEAMQKTLGIAGVKIEILSSLQQPVPTGEVVFPRNGVQPPATTEVMWRGYVQSGKGAKFPIWARARITVSVNRVVAAADLQSGKPIQKNELKVEASEESPFDDGFLTDLNDAAGLLAKTRIPKAAPIRKSQVEQPMDVARGDLVRVDVFTGGAHLSLEAKAETAGIKGATVTVRNLSSGRDFQAKVMGKDLVVVGGME